MKAIRTGIESEMRARKTVADAIHAGEVELDNTEIITLLEEEMLEAARNLEFERAAQLRDNHVPFSAREWRGLPSRH